MEAKRQKSWFKMEAKRQTSWFRTDKDIDFENSFKWWFALQWQNKYIQIFTIAFISTVIELVKFGWVIDTVYDNFGDEGVMGGIFTIMGLSIPPIVTMIVAYKAFWQYFNDMKNGTSR